MSKRMGKGVMTFIHVPDGLQVETDFHSVGYGLNAVVPFDSSLVNSPCAG